MNLRSASRFIVCAPPTEGGNIDPFAISFITLSCVVPSLKSPSCECHATYSLRSALSSVNAYIPGSRAIGLSKINCVSVAALALAALDILEAVFNTEAILPLLSFPNLK